MATSEDLQRRLAPTGVLRAAINLGNPILTNGDAQAPGGLTVAIAHEIGARLGLDVSLVCVDAARHSFQAMVDGRVDLVFLAIEPARESDVAFTEPYVVIEGTFAVPQDSPLDRAQDVDATGVRIGVREGSAYDLYLTRTLQAATVVRGAEATDVFEDQGLDVIAGIRQPIEQYATERGLRVLEPAFMEIKQAVGLPRSTDRSTLAALQRVVDDLKASGFIAEHLRRNGQVATVPDFHLKD